jgi:hypothetical protein
MISKTGDVRNLIRSQPHFRPLSSTVCVAGAADEASWPS